MNGIKAFSAAMLLVSAAPCLAQDAAEAPPAKAQNDGLDPTSPAKFVKLTFEHVDLAVPDVAYGNNANSFYLEYQQPFGHNALKFKMPVTSVDVLGDSGFGIGDISFKLTHVFGVTKKRGMVINAELIVDSATRPELGTGKYVIKPGFTYAWFLKGGHIFAPAVAQSISFAGDTRRDNINITTVDFYFVPKLANPKLYMTLDPAFSVDWLTDRQYLITALTLGYKLGNMMGGNGQMFIKPQFGLGGDRPANWGISAGIQLLNF